jgi:hypothetical protein
MTRNMRQGEVIRRAKALRQAALDRPELRGKPSPREASSGPTSMAVKIVDAGDRALIDAALAARNQGPT